MKTHCQLFTARRLALGILLLTTASCSVSEQVKERPSSRSSATSGLTEEQRENTAYEQVQFRLNFVDEARLGGQDIMFARTATDLTPAQQTQLQTAAKSGNLPLRLRMRFYARNPGPDSVRLQRLDYQLMLDNRELATGSTGANLLLQGSAIETLPLLVETNAQPRLAGTTPAAFAAGLADFTSSARRLSVRIRPTFVSAAGRTFQPTPGFMPASLVTVKR